VSGGGLPEVVGDDPHPASAARPANSPMTQRGRMTTSE
jgi:hypothetical protein